MSLLPFWTSTGERVELSGVPDSVGNWVMGQDLSTTRRELLDSVEALMSKKATSVSILSSDNNLTLLVVLEDGQSVIVRQSHPTPDVEEMSWRNIKLSSEIYLLRWLAENSDLEVPRVLETHTARDTDPGHPTFMVMEKLPGTMLMNVYGNMSISVKNHLIESYADVALRLFNLQVPQQIGSLTSGPLPSTPSVMPKLGRQRKFSADRVFENLQQYFEFLFELKRNSESIGSDTETKERGRGVLQILENQIFSLVQAIPASLLYCVLVHDDPNPSNILLDDVGNVTAVVDWEYHSLQPAILAAEYPSWLDYSACCDPRFAMPTDYWLDSQEESKRLCEVFEEVVKARDPKFYAALTQGVVLRSVVKWLVDVVDDHACERLSVWMKDTFPL